MKLDRTCYINPVEPEFLAFRLSSGIETKIDFHFKQQGGAPHPEDVVAQLQLTSRSQDQTEYYSVPATDIVNGVARAVIPAGLAYDPNGWRLRLTGTVDTEPRVIAYGVVTAVAGAGPQVEPQDVIDQIDLTLQRNSNVVLNVKLWTDESKGVPFDMTITTILANVYAGHGGPVLEPFTVTTVSPNEVEISLTEVQINGLPDTCWWTLAAAQAAGITTLCEGTVTVSGIVTPTLPTTTANWDYQMPATNDDPIAGQIIQPDLTQNILKVSIYDDDANDMTAMLALVLPSDTITIDVTTWTIVAVHSKVDWYEFLVLPIAQAAVSGVVAVTFTRPA